MTGLEKLREALDTKNEGDRRAWTAVLLPFGTPLKAAAARTVSVKLYVAIAAAFALAGSVAVVRFGHPGSTVPLPLSPRGASAPSEPMGIPALLPIPVPVPIPQPSLTPSTAPPSVAPSTSAPRPLPRPALIARDAPKDAAPTARPADTGPAKPPARLDPDAVGGTRTEVVNGMLAPGTP